MFLHFAHLLPRFSLSSVDALVHLLLHFTELHWCLVLRSARQKQDHFTAIQTHPSYCVPAYTNHHRFPINTPSARSSADGLLCSNHLHLHHPSLCSVHEDVSAVPLPPRTTGTSKQVFNRVCFPPFDGEGQVLHLWVLLFDLFGEVHDDFLQLRYQSGLSQTDVLVQRGCLVSAGGQNKRLRILFQVKVKTFCYFSSVMYDCRRC